MLTEICDFSGLPVAVCAHCAQRPIAYDPSIWKNREQAKIVATKWEKHRRAHEGLLEIRTRIRPTWGHEVALKLLEHLEPQALRVEELRAVLPPTPRQSWVGSIGGSRKIIMVAKE